MESDELIDVAKDIRESLETLEKKPSEIVVPPFALGIRFLDFNDFCKVRDRKVNLRTLDENIRFKQSGDWFYENLGHLYRSSDTHRKDFKPEVIDGIPEFRALLNPHTGYIIRDVQGIDKKVEMWATGSGHQMPWGGGNAMGRLQTLSRLNLDRFGNYTGERVGECIIRTHEGKEISLSQDEYRKHLPKAGDNMITIALSGDNFFDFQLLRPDPTNPYELRGVYIKSEEEDGSDKPFTIGAYHMGQNVKPIPVALKRYTDLREALPYV